MPSLVVKVKTKMALTAHDKVRGMLEGQYGSVFKGRSMDFDDLREYIPGDDVKDIDWKATARSGSTRIRRYIAIRKHNIMLVVDSGRNMAATTAAGDNKKDVAVMAAGIVGHIAIKNGDLVGMVSSDKTRPRLFQTKGDYQHLEAILQFVNTTTTLSDDNPPSNLAASLEYITRTLRKQMMVVIVADERPLDERERLLLKRIRAQHEVLWLSIKDASGLGQDEYYDIDDLVLFGGSIAHDKKIHTEYQEALEADESSHHHMLEQLGISHGSIDGDNDLVNQLYETLKRQKHARRR